jgi:hypothetical protein
VGDEIRTLGVQFETTTELLPPYPVLLWSESRDCQRDSDGESRLGEFGGHASKAGLRREAALNAERGIRNAEPKTLSRTLSPFLRPLGASLFGTPHAVSEAKPSRTGLPLPYLHLSLRPLRLPGRATAPAVARCVEGFAVRRLPFPRCSAVLCVLGVLCGERRAACPP